MRIAVTWSGVSGFFAACMRELLKRPGHTVKAMAIRPEPGSADPFHKRILPDGLDISLVTRDDLAQRDTAIAQFHDFNPDLILLSGWTLRAYRALALDRRFRDSTVVMGLDTRKQGTWRQYFGPLLMRRLFRRMDAWWVPGTLGRELLADWRINPARVFDHFLAIDDELFRDLPADRAALGAWPRQFLFVGQYIPRKGIDLLMDVLARYREAVGAEAWPLVCCGTGPMQSLLPASGVEDAGFVQPEELAPRMAHAGALLLPSRSDAWGQVVVESAVAGLPVIATDACGASVDAIADGETGFVIPAGDADALLDRMLRLHRSSDAELRSMGQAGHDRCMAYSATRWAQRLEEIAAATPVVR